MKHRFHPEARHEYGEQVQHYEGRRRGLGAEFVTEVERTIARICLHPERYRVEVPSDIHSLSLLRFPVRVIYIVIDDRVQVLALAHTRRRSRYWASRVVG